jgi:transcriptional regulator with XRE-family HTH domain
MAGLSQIELARKAGISQSSVHDIEYGKTKSLRSTTLFRMAKALGQTPEWLAGGTDKAFDLVQNPKDEHSLSKDEQSILESFCKLTAAEKKIVVRMVRALAIDK